MTERKDMHIRAIPLTIIDLESLVFIHNKGPIWDGDLPSKSSRDTLLDYGLVAKVTKGGKYGYQACTYRGAELLRAFQYELDKFD